MQILSKVQAALSGASHGGKVNGLFSLMDFGGRVPDFYVITDFKNHDKLEDALVTEELARWVGENEIPTDWTWAVRSSAAQEDGADKSFAGQYQTVLNVKTNALAEAIQQVFLSYQKETAYSKKATKFGIVIQRMLVPDYSGVFFSKDPLNAYSNSPVINLIPGLGDPLVSGKLSGYSINFKGEEVIYAPSEELIEGEIEQDGKLVSVKKSAEELFTAIKPHVGEMLVLAARIESDKNLPFDFEFAIQEGVLYWLQVRPITTRALKEPFEVWDNTSVEANYEGLTLPLSISFVNRTVYKAYAAGGKTIGFSAKVLKENENRLLRMCGGVYGGLYYNVTAWQSLLYQMPGGKKLSQKLPHLWGMEEAPFKPNPVNHSGLRKAYVFMRLIGKLFTEGKERKGYQQLYDKTLKAHESGVILEGDFEKLKAAYLTLEKELSDNWLAPVLNGFYTMVVFTLFKRTIAKSKVNKAHPNFVNDILFSDGDVISLQLVKAFQKLVATAANKKRLKSCILDNPEEEVLLKLKENHPIFETQINDYISQFGSRTEHGELKMETVTYKKDPTTFVSYLKANVQAFVPRKAVESFFDYKAILKQHYPINFIKRGYLGGLARKTVKRVKARENYRFMRTETFGVIRDLFMKMGEVLYAKGVITDKRDVLYLELDELLNKNPSTFKGLIDARKIAYESHAKVGRVNRYIYVQNKFSPIMGDEAIAGKDKIKGTGCCSGLVAGEVVVLDDSTDLSQDFNGKILVAYFFQPGWIGLFNQAEGIISERGNLLSHTAIICRELNVPSIVGAKGLMKTLKTGQHIEMDGATGIVNLNLEQDV